MNQANFHALRRLLVILLNYAHPLTAEQLTRVATLVGQAPTVRDIVVQIDRSRMLGEIVIELAAAAGLSSVEWQTKPLLLNPPGLAPLALALLAELHGRCGYFLPILNLHPVANALPPRYDVAGIVSLQALRDMARGRR